MSSSTKRLPHVTKRCLQQKQQPYGSNQMKYKTIFFFKLKLNHRKCSYYKKKTSNCLSFFFLSVFFFSYTLRLLLFFMTISFIHIPLTELVKTKIYIYKRYTSKKLGNNEQQQQQQAATSNKWPSNTFNINETSQF